MVEQQEICLTIAIGPDKKPTPFPIKRSSCHCNGVHFKAMAEIYEDKDGRKIKIDANDYAKFLELNKHLL